MVVTIKLLNDFLMQDNLAYQETNYDTKPVENAKDIEV